MLLIEVWVNDITSQMKIFGLSLTADFKLREAKQQMIASYAEMPFVCKCTAPLHSNVICTHRSISLTRRWAFGQTPANIIEYAAKFFGTF